MINRLYISFKQFFLEYLLLFSALFFSFCDLKDSFYPFLMLGSIHMFSYLFGCVAFLYFGAIVMRNFTNNVLFYSFSARHKDNFYAAIVLFWGYLFVFFMLFSYFFSFGLSFCLIFPFIVYLEREQDVQTSHSVLFFLSTFLLANFSLIILIVFLFFLLKTRSGTDLLLLFFLVEHAFMNFDIFFCHNFNTEVGAISSFPRSERLETSFMKSVLVSELAINKGIKGYQDQPTLKKGGFATKEALKLAQLQQHKQSFVDRFWSSLSRPSNDAFLDDPLGRYLFGSAIVRTGAMVLDDVPISNNTIKNDPILRNFPETVHTWAENNARDVKIATLEGKNVMEKHINETEDERDVHTQFHDITSRHRFRTVVPYDKVLNQYKFDQVNQPLGILADTCLNQVAISVSLEKHGITSATREVNNLVYVQEGTKGLVQPEIVVPGLTPYREEIVSVDGVKARFVGCAEAKTGEVMATEFFYYGKGQHLVHNQDGYGDFFCPETGETIAVKDLVIKQAEVEICEDKEGENLKALFSKYRLVGEHASFWKDFKQDKISNLSKPVIFLNVTNAYQIYGAGFQTKEEFVSFIYEQRNDLVIKIMNDNPHLKVAIAFGKQNDLPTVFTLESKPKKL